MGTSKVKHISAETHQAPLINVRQVFYGQSGTHNFMPLHPKIGYVLVDDKLRHPPFKQGVDQKRDPKIQISFICPDRVAGPFRLSPTYFR